MGISCLPLFSNVILRCICTSSVHKEFSNSKFFQSNALALHTISLHLNVS